MFVFAIETCGKTVALIQEEDRIMLDGFLSGEREEGHYFREQIPKLYWNGTSPFTARLATSSEHLDFDCMPEGLQGVEELAGESLWYFYGDIPAAFLKAERAQREAKAV
jgi:hypothetical protein